MEGVSYRGNTRDLSNVVLLNRAIDYFNNEYEQNLETNKIDPTNFADIYSQEEIEKDYLFVEKKKQEFKQKDIGNFKSKENKRISEVFEKILSLRGEQNDWFGDYFYMTNTSDFDDFKNKADILGIFTTETEDADGEDFTGVIFDVTSATDQNLQLKLQSNLARISGHLTEPEIKYFEHDEIKYKGKLKKIIPLVVGLDSANTRNLIMELYTADIEKKRKEMAEHPCSILLLKEIQAQLEGYTKILEKSDPKKYFSKVEKLKLIIEAILNSKKSLSERPETRDLVKNDRVIGQIRHFFLK